MQFAPDHHGPAAHINPPREAPINPEPPAARRTPVAALVYCAVLALGLTALGLLLLAAGVVVAPFAILIGLVLLTPAALMWTGIVRVATRKPNGAVLLLATVATVGAVLTILAMLPVPAAVALGISGMREGTVIIIGLLHLGGAALLAPQVFGRSRAGPASTHSRDDQ